MCYSRFDSNNRELGRLDTLAAPLAEIERGGLSRSQENKDASMFHDRARAHVHGISSYRGPVALFVLELNSAVAAGNQFYVQRQRSLIQTAASSANGERYASA